MKALIEIDEHNKNVIDRFADGEGCDILPENIFTDLIKSVKNGIPIHDNATNGDVIEAMFPKAEIEENDVTNTFGIIWEKTEHLTIYIATFARVWWDAPYRAESEGEE